MAEFFVQKVKSATSYALMPAHVSDLEAVKKLPAHQPIRVKVTRIRNVDHHRKYFALLNYAFDVWEPPIGFVTGGGAPMGTDPMPPYYHGVEIEKNFDRFRKDIAILCGFYEASYRLNGEVRLQAKSISFASMDQDEFEQLYDKTIDVIVKHVLKSYSGDELRNVVDQVMEFDS